MENISRKSNPASLSFRLLLRKIHLPHQRKAKNAISLKPLQFGLQRLFHHHSPFDFNNALIRARLYSFENRNSDIFFFENFSEDALRISKRAIAPCFRNCFRHSFYTGTIAFGITEQNFPIRYVLHTRKRFMSIKQIDKLFRAVCPFQIL